LEKIEQTCLNRVATQENNGYRIGQSPNTNHRSKKTNNNGIGRMPPIVGGNKNKFNKRKTKVLESGSHLNPPPTKINVRKMKVQFDQIAT
jgi:hypothetical protein